MKKKAIALAIASAMVVPNAFAAQDTSGMQYTSASEGFWASLRVHFNSGERSDSDIEIKSSHGPYRIYGSSSRFGARGSNDLGNGLVGFYAYEVGMFARTGLELETRQLHVGLRGAFGEVRAGSFWTAPFNMVYGSTDVANRQSGEIVFAPVGGFPNLLPGIISRSVQYTTPDLNGFQGAVVASMINDGPPGVSTRTNAKNTIDYWALAGSYSISGFTVAGTYNTRADYGDTLMHEDEPLDEFVRYAHRAHPEEEGVEISDSFWCVECRYNDVDSWAIRLAYEQDNWYVTSWYGEIDYSGVSYIFDSTKDGVTTRVVNIPSDPKLFSFAAGIAVDNVDFYVVYDSVDNAQGAYSAKNHFGTVGVQYNFTSKSRIWVEYAGQDASIELESFRDDYVSVGLRHDF
jgi:predicted porin